MGEKIAISLSQHSLVWVTDSSLKEKEEWHMPPMFWLFKGLPKELAPLSTFLEC
jgi:hypothetical protein